MKTIHEHPWNDEYQWNIFRKAAEDVKTTFDLENIPYMNLENIDSYLYRHWIVAYAVRHAIEFVNTEYYNFVEAGTAEGFSTFFALREITNHKKTKGKSTMHLYDAWEVMEKNGLTTKEVIRAETYSKLDIEKTKKNLSEFSEITIYHQWHVPETFKISPASPNNIVFLHIDINSAKSTLSTLKFFYPKLTKGGLILFDDYGWLAFNETKEIIDKFFSNKPGMLLKFPTGQAIYYR